MENLSHSRQPNRGPSTFSKKIHSNGAGGGFKGTKNLCDEVYGGLPNFGVSSLAPRLEDYSEIFGSFNTSRASSIPVLDLPNVDETEVFFDARSSSFDYKEVFGGFNGVDFAVSYEDLVNRSEAGDGDSSDEAWTPAASDTLSEESDLSGKDHQFSNEGPYPSFDDSPEFSMSYHKVNQRSNEDMLNGIAHAVPGFTCLVDEMPTSQHKIAKKLSLELEETDDSNLTNGSGGGQPIDNDIGPHRFDRNNSCHRETVVNVSEINLRTQPCQVPPPSRPPPLTEVKKGHHNKFVSDYSTIAYEGTSGDSSPRFFDVEVDACSSAAASAAAIKEAMEKAKLKLRSAKELMEKKKECFQSNSGSGSRKDIKAEERVSKIVDRSGRMKVEGVNGICERQESVREEKEKFRKTAREVPEVLEGESTSSTAERNTVEKHENESWSAKDSCKVDGASQWEEESQFFELVTTDESMKDFEQTRNKKIPGQDAKVHGQNEKAAIIALEEQSENVGIVKAFREDHDVGELEKELKVRIEPCVFEESKVRSVPVRKASEQKDHEKKTTLTAENCELGKHGKNFTMEKHCFETEKKMNVSDKLNKYDSRVEAKEKESKFLVKQNLMGADKIVESGKKPKQSHQNVAHKERIKEGFEAAENEKRLKVLEEEENEKRSKALLEKAVKEKRLKEALEQQGNERRLQLASELQRNGRTQQLASEQQGNGRTLQLDFEQLENEKRLEARQRKKSEKKLKETSQIEEHEKQLSGAPEQERFDRRHKEACERELDSKFKFSYENTEVRVSVMACESENDRKRSVEAHQKDKRKTEHEALEQVETYNFPKEVSEWEETAKMFKQDIDLEERKELNKGYCSMQKDEINGEIKSTKGNNMHMKEEVQLAKEKLMHVEEEVKSTEGNHLHLEKEVKSVKQNQLHMEEEDLCVCDEPCELDFINFGPSQSRNHDESSREIKASDVANGHEANGEMRAEYRTNEKQPRAVEIENVSVCESSKASERDEEDLEHEKCQSRKKEAKESLPLDDSVKKVSGEIEREDSENGKTKCRIQSSDVSLPSNNYMKETGEAGAFAEQPNEEKTKSCPQVESLPEIQEKGSAIQRKEGGEDVKNAQLASIQKHNREKVMPAQTLKECVEDIRKTEASRLAASEGKQKSQKSGEEATQTTERRGMNIGEPFVPQERETERMKREKEQENERLRKIEEEREREREREKDRMAVDLATVEARERAYAEARDRAERAALERMTTEARQRAMAEARERLERAGAEVREKSSAGKAAMEAKLRAERAAVERAMAEAREHAAEKAKAEARERIQRSVSDKFYTSSRNNGMTQSTSSSDLQGTQFHSKGSLRYSYSSSYGERYEGVEGESAQRCKARLERQCRTTERAAKALAEKNMRDLLAQREQAERNRVAVTLDADVRRWSSGKEGNLRALLSTLQYILGPDSGWQPVPLTEVITAAAVKKAYRKATLCVHPDKLQQRGASIQQKYISEKVFDLLKEAWNKFNSEER